MKPTDESFGWNVKVLMQSLSNGIHNESHAVVNYSSNARIVVKLEKNTIAWNRGKGRQCLGEEEKQIWS